MRLIRAKDNQGVELTFNPLALQYAISTGADTVALFFENSEIPLHITGTLEELENLVRNL